MWHVVLVMVVGRRQGSEVIAGRQPPGLPPAPAAGVHVLETGPARFGIESADGRNAIFLTGRLHFDVGDYLDLSIIEKLKQDGFFAQLEKTYPIK